MYESKKHIFSDIPELNKGAADFFQEAALTAVTETGSFVVSLAGGGTPKGLYALLKEQPYLDKIPWEKVIVLWGDERCVPANSPESNTRMAQEALLNHVPIPASNIHAIDGTLAPEDSAFQYENNLKQLLAANSKQIDLCLLGLGDDGHTASLFPHTSVLHEKERWVKEVYVEKLDRWRITLTAPFLNQSNTVLFLVSGAKKAAILPKVIQGGVETDLYPSQLIINEHANVHWFMDQDAAALI